MRERTVRAGEEELFKSQAREQGTVKLIDLITARLDTPSDSYLATLPSLRLSDVRIDAETVSEQRAHADRRLLRRDQLEYDAAIAQERNGRPFGIRLLRPIQLSKRGVLDDLGARPAGRSRPRSGSTSSCAALALSPDCSPRRAQDMLLLRMVPFVERNYNMVELGPRGTGKSHLFQQISPYSHLVSGGKATVARMFVNNANGQRGLVCQYDVVCFDEISGVSFDQKDGVNIMKGYMESGEFSRGRESIRADGSIVMVGNFEVDVEHQQRIGHLFGPLPQEMRNDTAFMDRIHAYLPGWDVPKLDTISLHASLRPGERFPLRGLGAVAAGEPPGPVQGRVRYGSALSGRDTTAVNHTVNGLLKLLYPDRDMPILTRTSSGRCGWPGMPAPGQGTAEAHRQRRVPQYPLQLSDWARRRRTVCRHARTAERRQSAATPCRRARCGRSARVAWTKAPASTASRSTSAPGRASTSSISRPRPLPGEHEVRRAEPAGAGQRDWWATATPASTSSRPAARFRRRQERGRAGFAGPAGPCSALLGKSLKGGLVAVGGLNLGGGLDPVYNAVNVAELAVEKGATMLLIPISARRQLNELSDDMAMKLTILYYADAREALIKALGD